MREMEVRVSFLPSGQEAFVLRGTRLIEAASCAGIVLETPCGGEGTCGKCRVRIARNPSPPTDAESRHFSAEELQQGWRLACQTVVCESSEVEIPAASLVATQHQILVCSEPAATTAPDDPPVRKCFVQLDPPTRLDDRADLLRLEQALSSQLLENPPLTADLSLLRELPARLRNGGFRGAAVLAGRRLIDFEKADAPAETFAAAIDVGTTTLAASLLDLRSGEERAVASLLNPQTQFGDDVLSRILFSRQRPDGLLILRESMAVAIDAMLGELCRQAGIVREQIYELTFAGNTTMQQMLCGVDCRALGEVPFTAATCRELAFPASEIGLHVHPRGVANVLPAIGGFVGGDTVAGILATDLADAVQPTLLVDIGTNGEIVLLADGKLSAASTAAGPAFEGARISRGMRGSQGAIEKVACGSDGVLRINVIGNVAPVGLCGSGLVDAAAELLRHRLLTCEGRLLATDQLPDGVPKDLADRLIVDGRHVSFTLATAEETPDGRPLLLTQRDLRELQLASGAIRAGITILLRRAGLEPADLDRVLIAGGFGNFVRRSNAQRIGLLPGRIEHHRIRSVGNASLAGAKLVASSLRARALAEELAERTEHIDLSADADFQDLFAEAMVFPDA